MKDIKQVKYRITFNKEKNVTKEWLLSNGFRYNRLFSDSETEVYTYRFPVHKYKKFTTLECELKIIIGENELHIDVYDYNTMNNYAPFYDSEYGDYTSLLETIWKRIKQELVKLNIKVTDIDVKENK